jgi:hypothetical protein
MRMSHLARMRAVAGLCVMAWWADGRLGEQHARARRAQAACADVASAAPCTCGRETAPVRVLVRVLLRETQRMLTTVTAQVLDVAKALPPYPVEVAAAPPAYAAK